MSNKTFFTWGFLVMIFFFGIIIIYINNKDELKFTDAKKEIKQSVKQYIKDNNVEIENGYTYNVTSEALINNGYIKELIVDKKMCSYNVNVKKYIIFLYDFDFNCTK